MSFDTFFGGMDIVLVGTVRNAANQITKLDAGHQTVEKGLNKTPKNQLQNTPSESESNIRMCKPT